MRVRLYVGIDKVILSSCLPKFVPFQQMEKLLLAIVTEYVIVASSSFLLLYKYWQTLHFHFYHSLLHVSFIIRHFRSLSKLIVIRIHTYSFEVIRNHSFIVIRSYS